MPRSKRDEVAAALGAAELKKARAAASEWKAEPVDPSANEVEVPPEWNGADTRTASVDMSKAIRNIQAILDNNGFDAGKPDGVMGDKTRSAIKAFQKSVGDEPTGKVSDALIRKLLDLNQRHKDASEQLSPRVGLPFLPWPVPRRCRPLRIDGCRNVPIGGEGARRGNFAPRHRLTGGFPARKTRLLKRLLVDGKVGALQG